MAGTYHKEWVKAKKTLGDASLNYLKKQKSDLGPNLDKFEKLRDTLKKGSSGILVG